MKALKKLINRSKEDKSTVLNAETATSKSKKGLLNFRRKSSSSHSIENLGLGQTVPSTSFDEDDELAIPKSSKSSEPVPLSVCGYMVDLNKKLPDSFTKLHKACWAGNEEKVVNLTTGSKSLDINARDHELRTPLHLAAARGLERIVKHLIKQSPDYSLKDSFGRTALSKAVEGHHFACVLTLLDAGADPNSKDNDGNTCLHWALLQNFSDIALSLLQREVDCNASNKDGVTPLHLAASSKQLGVVRRLISDGANVNAQDASNRTPLMLAALSGSVPVVSFLLDNGAEFNLEDKDSQTALQIAEVKGHQEVIAMLNGLNEKQEENTEIASEGISRKSSETIETKATKQSDNDLDNLSWNDSSGSNSPLPPKRNQVKPPLKNEDINKNPALRKLSDFMADLGMSDVSDDDANSSNGSLAYEPEFDFTKKLSSIADKGDNDKDTVKHIPEIRPNTSDTNLKDSYLSVQTKIKADDDDNSSWSDSSLSITDKKDIAKTKNDIKDVSPNDKIDKQHSIEPQDIELGKLSVKSKEKTEEDSNSIWSDSSSTSVQEKPNIESNGANSSKPFLAEVVGMVAKIPSDSTVVLNSPINDASPLKPPRGRKGSRSKSLSSNSGNSTPKNVDMSSKNASPQNISNQRKPSRSSFDSHSSVAFRLNDSALSTEDEVIAQPNFKQDSISIIERKPSVSSFDSESAISNESMVNEMIKNFNESTGKSRLNDSALIAKPNHKRDSITSDRKASVSSFDSELGVIPDKIKNNVAESIIENRPNDAAIIAKPNLTPDSITSDRKASVSSFDSELGVEIPNQTKNNVEESIIKSRTNDSAIIAKPIHTGDRKASLSSFDSESNVSFSNNDLFKKDTLEVEQSRNRTSNQNEDKFEVKQSLLESESLDNPKLSTSANGQPSGTVGELDQAVLKEDHVLNTEMKTQGLEFESKDDFESDCESSSCELKLDMESAKDFGSRETLGGQSSDGTLGRISTLQGVDEIWVENSRIEVKNEVSNESPDNGENKTLHRPLKEKLDSEEVSIQLKEIKDINVGNVKSKSVAFEEKLNVKHENFDGSKSESASVLTKTDRQQEILVKLESNTNFKQINNDAEANIVKKGQKFKQEPILVKNDHQEDVLVKNDHLEERSKDLKAFSKSDSKSNTILNKNNAAEPNVFIKDKLNGQKFEQEPILAKDDHQEDILVKIDHLEESSKDLKTPSRSDLKSNTNDDEELNPVTNDHLDENVKISETSLTSKTTLKDNPIQKFPPQLQNELKTAVNKIKNASKDTSPVIQQKLTSELPRKGLGLGLKPYKDDPRSLFKETIVENQVFNSYSESASSNGESTCTASSKQFKLNDSLTATPIAVSKPMRPSLRRRHTVDNMNVNSIKEPAKNLDGDVSSSSSDNLVADKNDFLNTEATSSKRNSIVRNQFRFSRAKSVDFGDVGERLITKRRVSTDFRVGSCEQTAFKVRKPSLTKSSTMSSLDESLPHSVDEDDYDEYSHEDDSFHQVSNNPNPMTGEDEPNLEDEVFSHLNIPVAKPTLYNVVVDLLRNRSSNQDDSLLSPKLQGQIETHSLVKRASLLESDSSPTVSDSEDNDCKNGDDNKTLHGSESEISLSDDPLNKDIKTTSALLNLSSEVTDVHALLAKCRIALSKEEGRKKIYYKKLKSTKRTLDDFKKKHESIIEHKNALETELLEVKNQLENFKYQLKDEKERNSTNEILHEKLQLQINSRNESNQLKDMLKKSGEEIESKNKLLLELNLKVAKMEDSLEKLRDKNDVMRIELENSKIEINNLNEKLKLSVDTSDNNQASLLQELETLKQENVKLKTEKLELNVALSSLENQSKTTISNLEQKLSTNEIEKQSNFMKSLDNAKDLSLKVEEVAIKMTQGFQDNQKLKETVENISDTILAKLNSIAHETNSVSKQLSNQKEIFAKIEHETHSGIAKIDEKSEDLCQKIAELSSKFDEIPIHDEDKEMNHLSNLMIETKEHFNATILKIEDNLINIINEQGSFLHNLETQVVSLTDKVISMKLDEERRANQIETTTRKSPIIIEPIIESQYVESLQTRPQYTSSIDKEILQTNYDAVKNRPTATMETQSVTDLNNGIQSLQDKLESILETMKDKERSSQTQPSVIVTNPSPLELELSKELKKLEKDNMEMINHHQLLQEKFTNQTREITKLQEELQRIKASDNEKAKHNYEMTQQTLQSMTQQRDHLNSCLDKEKELNRKLMDESRTFVVEFNTLRHHLKDIQQNLIKPSQTFQTAESPNMAIKEKLNDLKYQVDFLQHKIEVEKDMRLKNEDSLLNSLKMDFFALKNEQTTKLSALETSLQNLRGNAQFPQLRAPEPTQSQQDCHSPEKYFGFYKDIFSMFNERSLPTHTYAREMSYSNPQDNLSDSKNKIMDDVINLRSSLQVNKCQCEKLLKENLVPNYVSYVTAGASSSTSTPEKICNNLCSTSRPSSSRKKFEDFRRTDLKFSVPLNNYAMSLAETSLLDKDKSYKDIAEIYSLKAQSRLDASLDSLQIQMDL